MEIIPQIGVFIPLLPAVIALRYWKKMNRSQRLFGLMLWSIAILSISGRLWTLFGYQNNLPFFHVYILVEGLFLLFIFKDILGSFLHGDFWKFTALSFIVFWIYNSFWGEGISKYPASIHVAEALMILSFVISWFAKILREKELRNIQHNFEFWFCTGLLIFFSSNLLSFVFSSFIVEQSSRVFKIIWGVHAVLAILLYLIYSYALTCIAKTPK